MYSREGFRQYIEQTQQEIRQLLPFAQQAQQSHEQTREQIRSLEQQIQNLREQGRTEEIQQLQTRLDQTRRILEEQRDAFRNRINATTTRIRGISEYQRQIPEEPLTVVEWPLSEVNEMLRTPPELNEMFRTPSENISVPEIRTPDTLFHDSYDVLLRQLYGPGPVSLPQFLVINGIRANFISFEQITTMLERNEIERYIIDPLLQPWTGAPPTEYRIFTFFGKNGMTYLVRARYNAQTNQILP